MSGNKFWIHDPSILLDKNYIKQIWPTKDMKGQEKLNATSRLVILLTILGYLLTFKFRIIVIGAITLAAIIVLYYSRNNKEKVETKEGFTSPEFYKSIKTKVTTPTKDNPVMNVLLTELNNNPNRKPAAPAYNKAVEEEINNSTKDFIKESFCDEDIDKKLFNDLGDNFNFDRSMRAWYPMPNTTNPNDQNAFAEFCYGNMMSCKEPGWQPANKQDSNDGSIACSKNSPRHINY